MRGDAQETVMAKPSAVAREELGRTIRAAMSDAIGSDAGPAAKQHEAEWDALDEGYRERWRVVADAALTFAAARVAEERAGLAGEAASELERARSMFPAFNGPHEGYAVILEELDELWDEVKASKPGADRAAMRKEAIQVAAMALRFVHDVCGSPP